MYELKAGSSEEKFAELIWKYEPITSGKLAFRAAELWGWSKTTSFTVLRRLCNKGLFQNNKGSVTSLISREECSSRQSERFVEENFSGSLPAFVAAFTSRKKLSSEEIAELRRMVDAFEEEDT